MGAAFGWGGLPTYEADLHLSAEPRSLCERQIETRQEDLLNISDLYRLMPIAPSA